MRYHDNMTIDEERELLDEIEQLDQAYGNCDLSSITESDELEWWTERELRAMRP